MIDGVIQLATGVGQFIRSSLSRVGRNHRVYSEVEWPHREAEGSLCRDFFIFYFDLIYSKLYKANLAVLYITEDPSLKSTWPYT